MMLRHRYPAEWSAAWDRELRRVNGNVYGIVYARVADDVRKQVRASRAASKPAPKPTTTTRRDAVERALDRDVAAAERAGRWRQAPPPPLRTRRQRFGALTIQAATIGAAPAVVLERALPRR